MKKYFLFVNVFPSTIVHSDFPRFIEGLLNNYPDIKDRIVFEINEATCEESYWEQEVFSIRLSFLKSMSFRIAFDDLLSFDTLLNKVAKYAPDFVKLDHTYSEKLSDSLDKQKKIKFLLAYTQKKMSVVLECIETENDLSTAKKLGVPLIQGYYISQPHRL